MEIDKNSITAIVGNNGIGSLPFYDVYVDLKKSVKESWRLMEKYIRGKSA